MNIGLMGYKQAGKNTAANHLTDNYGQVQMAFADPMREMALAINPIVAVHAAIHGPRHFLRYSDVIDAHGYDEAKRRYPEVRRFLQALGTEAVREVLGEGAWVDYMENRFWDHVYAGQAPSPIAVTDVRFPNEVNFLRTLGFTLVWVDRPSLAPAGDLHPSETSVGPDLADFVVTNDTLPHLYEQLDRIVEGATDLEA